MTTYHLEDDQVTVSRSKLEHLLDMANDDRMQYSTWNFERVFGTIAQGLLFTSLGAILNYESLPEYGKMISIFGIMTGLLFGGYIVAKEIYEADKRKKYRSKIVTKLNELVEEMDINKKTSIRSSTRKFGEQNHVL